MCWDCPNDAGTPRMFSYEECFVLNDVTRCTRSAYKIIRDWSADYFYYFSASIPQLLPKDAGFKIHDTGCYQQLLFCFSVDI